MADRGTRQEAEELKAKFEANHPGVVIVIEERTGEQAMSPYGLGTTYQEEDIVRYDGDFPVIQWQNFSILEVTTCRGCGKEAKNAAIGQTFVCNECKTPKPKPPIFRKPAYSDEGGPGWVEE